jgi:hypothetical protein
MRILAFCKRIGQAVVISRSLVWLASDDADHVTGLNLYMWMAA